MTDQTKLEETYIKMIHERRGIQYSSLEKYPDKRVYLFDGVVDQMQGQFSYIRVQHLLTGGGPVDRYSIFWQGSDLTDKFNNVFGIEGRLDVMDEKTGKFDPILFILLSPKKDSLASRVINSIQFPASSTSDDHEAIQNKEHFQKYCRKILNSIDKKFHEEVVRFSGSDVKQEIESAPDNIIGQDRLKK